MHLMPLQRKAVILHLSFGISRDYPPSCVRKQGAGNDGTKAGWHGYLFDCHPYQRGAFLSLINYDKEKNGSARQATDGADSGASAHE